MERPQKRVCRELTPGKEIIPNLDLNMMKSCILLLNVLKNFISKLSRPID